MSEYQYYEFLAVDRPLDADQLDWLRALSTRAELTSTSFVNTYHWGDFKGNPRALMEEYFDAFLYTANWGSRQLMIRLPARLLDLETAQRYCGMDSASAWAHGENVIVEMRRENDDDGYWEEYSGEGRLASIIPARAQLASGDLRLLYLGWLLSISVEYQGDDLDVDVLEPPVPPNLALLNGPLRSVVDFLRLDEDLLAVAAEASERQQVTRRSEDELASWIEQLPAAEKNALLMRVVHGDDALLRTELLRRLNGQPDLHHQATRRRTVAELLEAAENHGQERERLAEQQQERERARRERAAAIVRRQQLDSLAREGGHAWQRVSALIDTKKTREYDLAVELLGDLRDLSERDGRLREFGQRVQRIRQQYPNRPGLLQRLDSAGFVALANPSRDQPSSTGSRP